MVDIQNRLPILKLCYEKFLHNKVSADEYMAIPVGKRALVWFTYEGDQHICLVLYLDSDNKITTYKKMVTCFSSDLVIGKGTILYGIMFNQHNQNNNMCGINNFAIINIHYLEGINVYNIKYREKIEVFSTFFKKISQNLINKESLLIGLPVISNNYNELTDIIPTLNYKIHSVKPVNLNLYNLNLNFKLNNNNRHNNKSNNNNKINNNKINNNKSNNNVCVLNVNASIEPDIYILGDIDNKIERVAYIPNYTTSVMMNKLFRNIKENDNLDLLEESDSESEFENIEEDKFVYLSKTIKMMCIFNYKFKKWIPVKISDENTPISVEYDIINIEKKYM